MTLPYYFSSPSSIDLAAIQAEFGSGGVNPIGLNEYYAGGLYVPAGAVGYPGGVETAIPASGTISTANFHGAGIISGATYATSVHPSFVLLATLPKAACWLKFYIVGGGGGGGGGDGGDGQFGGAGGAGVRGDGVLRLPQTSDNKLLYMSAASGGSPGQYNGTTPAGSTGYVFNNGFRTQATAGTGGLFGATNISGSGGSGAGPSVISYYSQGTEYPIMSVSGGGGGGGTGRWSQFGAPAPTPGNQSNRNTLYAHTSSLPQVNGTNGQGRAQYGAYDGGGGGGGGAPGGLGGIVPLFARYEGNDKSGYTYVGMFPAAETGATGGSAGYSNYNTSLSWVSAPTITNPTSRTQAVFSYGFGFGGAGGSQFTPATSGTGGIVSVAWSTSVNQPVLTPP